MFSEEWEDFPTYFQLLSSIQGRLQEAAKPSSVPVEQIYYNFNTTDVLLIIVTTIAWTVLRHLTIGRLLKPLGRRYALTPSNQAKMPESVWKFSYYVCSWSCNLYILVLSGDYEFLQKPSTIWDGWSLNESLPTKMYFFHIIQCGFYAHSLYATLFLDMWMKDSILMIIHHISALVLLLLSFSFRCHNIGCLVHFCHDACDIFLEFSKVNIYFKIQDNKTMKLHKVLTDISFLCFTVTWCVGRLFFFPLRVLYAALSNVNDLQSRIPCSLLMNSLLWALQIINIYWSFLILQTLYRILTGHILSDTREYDEEEKMQQRKKQQFTDKLNEQNSQDGNANSSDRCTDGDSTEINEWLKKED